MNDVQYIIAWSFFGFAWNLCFWNFSRNCLAGDELPLGAARRHMSFCVILGSYKGTTWRHDLAARRHMLFNLVFWVSGWRAWRWWTPAKRHKPNWFDFECFELSRLFLIREKGVLIIDWLKGKGLCESSV